MVMDAAAALGIREYDFFDLAFRRWFGRRAETRFLERVFADYMFHRTVPPWVRSLGREVLSRMEAGTLSKAALGAGIYQRHEKIPRLGWLNGIMSGLAVLAVYALIMAIFLFPGSPANMECRSASGNWFFESWVYVIAGKEKPPCDVQKTHR